MLFSVVFWTFAPTILLLEVSSNVPKKSFRARVVAINVPSSTALMLDQSNAYVLDVLQFDQREFGLRFLCGIYETCFDMFLAVKLTNDKVLFKFYGPLKGESEYNDWLPTTLFAMSRVANWMLFYDDPTKFLLFAHDQVNDSELEAKVRTIMRDQIGFIPIYEWVLNNDTARNCTFSKRNCEDVELMYMRDNRKGEQKSKKNQLIFLSILFGTVFLYIVLIYIVKKLLKYDANVEI
jgi:hypothetical protein